MIKELKKDMVMAILIVLLSLSILGSIVFVLLDVLKLWIALTINVVFALILGVYILSKYLNKTAKVETQKKRPELVDIIQPVDAWKYVKQFFQQNFGIILNLNNEKSYMVMKTVGQEGYETKIYSFFAESETRNHIDTYHIVLSGHNPQGLLFLKNETNKERINELEQGVAIKSQRFITETEIQEDELSGRRITKKKTSPLEEPQAPDEKPEGENDGKNDGN